MRESAATRELAVREDGRLLRGEATRERVLDAAERLFAEHGFDTVSIRQIAHAAHVTLGVVGFHGGSKLDLFRTILERRVATLSVARREALAALRAGGRRPDLRALIHAYMAPYLKIAAGGDPQWRAYARLIARIVSDDRWYPHVRDLYDPVAREYLEAIEAIHPEIDRKRLVTAFVLSVASMLSIVASTSRIAGLSGEDAGSSGPEKLLDYEDILIDFCVGGIKKAAFGHIT
jgi:AcrR family transcriptional regulator